MGPHYKSIRKVNTTKLNGNNCATEKCKAEEINKLLAIKKCVFEQPHYERWYVLCNLNNLNYFIAKYSNKRILLQCHNINLIFKCFKCCTI